MAKPAPHKKEAAKAKAGKPAVKPPKAAPKAATSKTTPTPKATPAPKAVAKAETKPAAAKDSGKKTGKPAPAPAVPEKPKKPKSDTAGKLIHLIAEDMAIEEAELTPAASFKEDLNLDEIDIAELLMQAEHAFHLPPFEEEEWESCETVQDFIQLVEARMAKSKAAKKASK